MDVAKRDEIDSKVLIDLEGTAYAATSLSPLSGGTANFVYHAKLQTPLPDGMQDVLIKHGEEFIANSPNFKLALRRCRVEEECLKACSELPSKGEVELTSEFKYAVRTPKFFHFDEQNNTQVQEILLNSKDLKTYVLKTYPADTPDTARLECLQLGRALGEWLRSFHTWTAEQPTLREVVAGNKEMQQLKHLINFSWLQDRIGQFPAILSEAKDVFEKVKAMAAQELQDEEQMQVIHGDFWTGNILLPDAPVREGDAVSVFVIDWELAQLGIPNLDLGQMVAEMYELKLYKNITAGLWMVQGFLRGYGTVTDEFAFRTAIQIGAHLVCFGTSVQGWGSQEQVEMVARTGRDIIVHAWNKDRKWFENSDLCCLFQ
ncbi:kinase-like domain-containing protein [Xylariaceae sp. FL0255]|nr:kinase-like domain-containing protein [Xylariaceae sp. FL0255]